jgi:hypothetical protein
VTSLRLCGLTAHSRCLPSWLPGWDCPFPQSHSGETLRQIPNDPKWELHHMFRLICFSQGNRSVDYDCCF